MVLLNTTIGNSQYVIVSDVVAGNHVDSGRTAGDMIIVVSELGRLLSRLLQRRCRSET